MSRRRPTPSPALTEAPPPAAVLYETSDHVTRIDVRIEDGSAWLRQAQMAELFRTSVANINLHLLSATGHTAPELIAERADHALPNIGLTTTVAKNFLREPEIAELNRLVVMFLDYAEDQARRPRAPTTRCRRSSAR